MVGQGTHPAAGAAAGTAKAARMRAGKACGLRQDGGPVSQLLPHAHHAWLQGLTSRKPNRIKTRLSQPAEDRLLKVVCGSGGGSGGSRAGVVGAGGSSRACTAVGWQQPCTQTPAQGLPPDIPMGTP